MTQLMTMMMKLNKIKKTKPARKGRSVLKLQVQRIKSLRKGRPTLKYPNPSKKAKIGKIEKDKRVKKQRKLLAVPEKKNGKDDGNFVMYIGDGSTTRNPLEDRNKADTTEECDTLSKCELDKDSEEHSDEFGTNNVLPLKVHNVVVDNGEADREITPQHTMLKELEIMDEVSDVKSDGKNLREEQTSIFKDLSSKLDSFEKTVAALLAKELAPHMILSSEQQTSPTEHSHNTPVEAEPTSANTSTGSVDASLLSDEAVVLDSDCLPSQDVETVA